MEEASAGNLFFQKQINWQSCGRKQLFYQNIAAVRRTSCDECILKCSQEKEASTTHCRFYVYLPECSDAFLKVLK